ncbi:HEAT repeat domain-containing protein [Chloroflexota bacterium]
MSAAEIYDLPQFCDELEQLVVKGTDRENFLPEAENLLKNLLPNKQFICQIMDKFITEDDYVRERIGTIDRHDLSIFLSPKGSFSIRLFVWLPGRQYPIHDHGAWGIVGGIANRTQEIRYNRLDDGTVKDYARLEETDRNILNPDKTINLLPYSIHHMSSNDSETSLTLHVYGKPVRKGFIQCFNIADNSIGILPTPRLDKRLHAIKALAAIGGDTAVTYLEKAFQDKQPLIRWNCIETMKDIDHERHIDLLKKALNDSDEDLRGKVKSELQKI